MIAEGGRYLRAELAFVEFLIETRFLERIHWHDDEAGRHGFDCC